MTQQKLNKLLAEHKKWLNSEGGKKIDLSDANLINANLRSADLRYANLINADLRNADLRYANLINSDLHNSNLNNADLNHSNLRSADLRYANLHYCILSNSDLHNSNLRYTDLSYADLRSANLRLADLRDADLSHCLLSNANLINANLGKNKIISVDQVGSRRGKTLFWIQGNVVWCGCFVGTLQEFSERIRSIYAVGDVYRKEYERVIAYFESWLEVQNEDETI